MTHQSGGTVQGISVSNWSSIAELQASQAEWNALLASSASDRPMQSHLWSLAWWQTFGSAGTRRLAVWTFRERGRLVGIVPMLMRRHSHFGILPMRRLELLASGEPQADEIMSEYLGPIVAKGYENAVAEAYVRQLINDNSSWQEVVLSALDGEAPSVVALQSELARQRCLYDVRTETLCPFISLPGRWEDYLASLDSRDRYHVNRSLRDFVTWAGDSWQVHRARTTNELAQGREILVQLHRRRWEKDDKLGAFSSPAFLQFHDRVLPQLLDQNALDLCWLTVRGRPVAAAYNIIWRNRLYFYQGGRETSVPKGVRPGVVLHLETIKRAIAEGREEYDFLGGPTRYKMQLASATRPLLGIRIVRPSLAEAARRLIDVGRTAVREARRRKAGSAPSSQHS